MSISFPTVFADLGKPLAALASLNCMGGAGAPATGYSFTVSTISTAPVVGAVYSNNGINYKVLATVKASGTNVAMAGAGPPLSSGTLTKVSGTGDSTLTFSAVTAYSNPIGVTVSATTTAPSKGDTYSNNGFIYTVIADVVATGTLIALSGNGIPNSNATMVQVTGAGDASLTVSAVTFSYPNWIANPAAASATIGQAIGPVVKNANQMVSDILTRLEGVGLSSLLGGTWQSSLLGIDQAHVSAKNAISQLVQNIVLTRVNNDVPQQSPTSLTQAMAEFIRQMQSQSITVQQATVSSAVTASGGNTGNATIVAGLFDQNGLLLEYTFNETMIATCTQDQYHGGIAGSESVTVVAPAQQQTTSYLWPAGSGITANLTVIDPTQGNGAGGNLIGGGSSTVGAFKAFSGSIPTAWTIDVGGATISDGTSSNYSGAAHCLLITGDGSTLTSLYQNFANGGITGGSSVVLLPNTVYLFCMHVKTPDASTIAGVLKVSITDGSLSVINSNAAIANTISTTVGGYGDTAWHTISGTFQTPTIMPANCRLHIYLTTAVTNAKRVLVDFAAMSQPSAQAGYGGLYAGGPFMSIFRGSVDLVNFISPTLGDYWQVAFTNNFGSKSSTPLSFSVMMNQTLGLAGLKMIMPSAGSPTVSDALIS